MIAPIKRSNCNESAPTWHAGFMAMLPRIKEHAEVAFRGLSAEAREDAICETVANAMVAYVGLVKRGKVDVAYPTVLARYGVAHFRAGRRVGSRLNSDDVLSDYAQKKKGFDVERLDLFDRDTGGWSEAVVEDRRTPVPEQAAFRIDFPRWLGLFSKRDRRIAEVLAAGHSTGEVAERFHLSPSRVSQKRREYFQAWQAFHDHTLTQDALVGATA